MFSRFEVLTNAAINANIVFSKQAVYKRSSQLLAGQVNLAVLLWEQRLSQCLKGARGHTQQLEYEENRVSLNVSITEDKSFH